jgi:hypothetical protein
MGQFSLERVESSGLLEPAGEGIESIQSSVVSLGLRQMERELDALVDSEGTCF